MRRHTHFRSVALLGLSLPVIATGCATTHTSTRTVHRETIYKAELDGCRDVMLSHDLVSAWEDRNPKRYSEEIAIRIKPREFPSFSATVKSLGRRSGRQGRSIDLGTIEARCNESQSRIWFIDRDAGCVIATVDRLTEQTTGPDDEHPAWADPNAGTRLKPVNK